MTISAITNQPFPRGANPTPAHRIMSATRYSSSKAIRAAPPQIAYVPAKLSYWLNDRYGICVTAEECFAKACYQPEIFIPDSVAEAWARKNGVLNGASLDEVLDWMVNGGFVVSGQRYNDGRKILVDYSNQTELQSAIAQGPVKIAIAADALPSGAGNQSGWYAVGGRTYRSTDHCVALSGYGPANWLYQQLGVSLPSGLASNPTRPGYLLFTWSTIGFVDHAWLMGACAEAWVRDPTTIGVPPLAPEPDPIPIPPSPPVPPSPPPVPPSPPSPPPIPPATITLTGEVRIPIVGNPTGEVIATCGNSTAVFRFVSAGNRKAKPVLKTAGDEKPDDDKEKPTKPRQKK